MASNVELVRLCNEGELGRLLAQAFRGERGHVNPCQDADLLVVFQSETVTPSADQIGRVIQDHYSKMGYKVVFNRNSRVNSADGMIFFGSSDDGCVCFAVTTHYPSPTPGTGNACLRISCNIIF